MQSGSQLSWKQTAGARWIFFVPLASLNVCVLGSVPEDVYLLRKKLESFSLSFLAHNLKL